MDDESDKISRLEDRIEQLEATIAKMLPGRRDALKLGGAAVVGAAAMSGTASAGSSQVGTIGSSNNLVDVEAEDINVSDTITTQDIVVNGTASGPFGGGGVVLESGDTISVHTIDENSTDSSMITLYSGTAKDVLGGIVSTGGNRTDFVYTFSDGTTINKNGTGTDYDFGNFNRWRANDGSFTAEVDFLPPALDVTQITVGSDLFADAYFGAEVILKD